MVKSIFQEKCVEENPKALSKTPHKKLTRRHSVPKVAEIFDIARNLIPIMAAIRLDLQVLVLGKLAWGDNIPDNL